MSISRKAELLRTCVMEGVKSFTKWSLVNVVPIVVPPPSCVLYMPADALRLIQFGRVRCISRQSYSNEQATPRLAKDVFSAARTSQKDVVNKVRS